MQSNKICDQHTKIHYLIIAGLLLYLFIFYWYSLTPAIYLIDSGELAAVSYTLGIAHPTGYPLYTIISYFFAHLPGEPAFNLNSLSAIFTITAITFIFFITSTLLKDSILALLPTLVIGSAPTIWHISITNEVYPLTILFVSLLLFLLFRLKEQRDLYLLSYIVGLSFTNHIIIFTLAIPLFFYVIIVHRPSLRKVLNCLFFFSVGISLYFYLLFRTQAGAALHWGDTYNFERLIWHITGKQYRVWMFSLRINEILVNLQRGLSIILRDLLYIFIIPVLAGFYRLYKFHRPKFFLFSAVIALNFIYAVNYSIPDINSYYIPALISLGIVLAYGLQMIKRYSKWFIAIPLSLLIPFLNYKQCSLRNNTFVQDLSYAHIQMLPKKSIIISNLWDVYSPLLYLQQVKKIRPDLVIIDKELLRRTWYLRFLNEQYPEFYEKIKPFSDAYLIELKKFEYDKPYAPAVIQSKFINLLRSFIKIDDTKNVYLIMPYLDRDLKSACAGYYLFPDGLNFKIQKEKIPPPAFNFTQLRLNLPGTINDERLAYIIDLTKKNIQHNITFLKSRGEFVAAGKIESWFNKIFRNR